jgi:hypothetical protein
MYWAVHTTLCSAFLSDAEQLPYQAVMQPVIMISVVQLLNVLSFRGPQAKSFFSLPEEEVLLLCLLHNFLGVWRTMLLP